MARWYSLHWALTIQVLALASGAASAQTEEPFCGEGTFTPVRINVGDCFDKVKYSAAGTSNVLGSFQGPGRLRVDYCGIYPDIAGDLYFTAANGDQLSVRYVGMRLDPTTYLAKMVATGGTGQYQGAIVDAFLLIENYNLSDSFDISFSGTIEFP
jgi:hypothetical protein